MQNVLFNCRWAVNIIVSSIGAMTTLILWNYAMCAKEIPQTEKIAQNTGRQEPDIEITVIDTLLNQAVFSPFRREANLGQRNTLALHRTWYTRVQPNVAETIVEEHLVQGNKVTANSYSPESA